MFELDESLCTGCGACCAACMDYLDWELDKAPAPRLLSQREYSDEKGDRIIYYVTSCRHCDDPDCVRACPTGAIARNSAGFTHIDYSSCVSCFACADACQYGAIRRGRGGPVKCGGCQERVEAGLEPICVEACPQGAVSFKWTGR